MGDLVAQQEVSALAVIDPLPLGSFSAISEAQASDVPDLDWLLNLSGLAQLAAPESNVIAWPSARSQVTSQMHLKTLSELYCLIRLFPGLQVRGNSALCSALEDGQFLPCGCSVRRVDRCCTAARPGMRRAIAPQNLGRCIPRKTASHLAPLKPSSGNLSRQYLPDNHDVLDGSTSIALQHRVTLQRGTSNDVSCSFPSSLDSRLARLVIFICSEALQKDGVLSGSGGFSLDNITATDPWHELRQAHTAPEPLPELLCTATEVCAALVLHQTVT